jgi:hypothetical protein
VFPSSDRFLEKQSLLDHESSYHASKPSLFCAVAVDTKYVVHLILTVHNSNSLLAAYAASIRLNSHGVSLSLAMLNTAGLVGRLTLGSLSDLINPWLLACTTLALCALSMFILWGVLSYSLTGLLLFSIVYGSLAGGWTSLWLRFIKPIASMFR